MEGTIWFQVELGAAILFSRAYLSYIAARRLDTSFRPLGVYLNMKPTPNMARSIFGTTPIGQRNSASIRSVHTLMNVANRMTVGKLQGSPRQLPSKECFRIEHNSLESDHFTIAFRPIPYQDHCRRSPISDYFLRARNSTDIVPYGPPALRCLRSGRIAASLPSDRRLPLSPER